MVVFENNYDNIRTLLNSFAEGIIFIDSKKKIIGNTKFQKLFHIKTEERSVILKILEKYGLTEVLDDVDFKKHIYINHKKITVENFNNNEFKHCNFTLVIFKEEENTYNNGFMNELIQSLHSMKDVLDNAYQGMALVNGEGRIVKWNYEKLFGLKEEDVIGKHVENVIDNTRLHIVAKTGKKELYDVQRIQGHDMIASRIPIIKDGKILGALGTVLFKDIKEVKELAKKLKILESTVDKYKEEINKMYSAQYSFDHIVTQNKKMLELKAIAKKAANSSSTVLIQGESGTGKEYFAHAIHNASHRKNISFIRLNCAAIPHELLESELFGYEGGSFTGAKKEGKIGKLELSNNGTLLLDEISSMPYSMQAKLLRVLEEREFERIGGNTRIKIDVKVIAATNEDMQRAVKDGRFRQDLFYRLNVIELNIPPLRDRMDDIPILSEQILNQLVQKMGFSYKKVTEKAGLALSLYNWPGNVRELRNVLERAANMSSSNYIGLEHLPDYISRSLRIDERKDEFRILKERVAEAEINAIMEALRLAGGSRTEAAKYLGIHRTALYKKMSGYGIDIKSV